MSRILKATKRLNAEKYKFKVLLVGDGIDTKNTKVMLKDINYQM